MGEEVSNAVKLQMALEPEACTNAVSADECFAASQAISLKRIADALERMGDQDAAYQIGMAIGNGINRSMNEAGR